jgi:MFS transporter, DHA1 family, multidrug resistance protein
VYYLHTGGFAAQAHGWRITIWIVAWMGAFTLVVLFFLMPETSAATILYRRAKRLRGITGDDRWRSQSEIDSANYQLRDHLAILG